MISTAGRLSSTRSDKTGGHSITARLRNALDLLLLITGLYLTRSTLNTIHGITKFLGISDRSSVRPSRASSTAWELQELS